jgi:hypothetical protein
MGNTATIQRHIGEEFKRVKEVTKKKYGDKVKDNYMVLDQVLQMQPFREHPVDISHLGTLFVLDSVRPVRSLFSVDVATAEKLASLENFYALLAGALPRWPSLRR